MRPAPLPSPIKVTSRTTTTLTDPPAPLRTPPPSPTLEIPPAPPAAFLQLTIRELVSDRWVELVVPREWRVARLKRDALEKLGYGEPDEASDERVRRVLNELSDSGKAGRRRSIKRSTPASPTTPTPATPRTPHSFQSLSTLPPGSPRFNSDGLPLDPDRANRRASIQLAEALAPRPRDDAVRRDRIDVVASKTRLVSAVIGCYVDESALVGSKLVQFDLLTLQPTTTYFDRPLGSYHLPFLRLPLAVLKPFPSLKPKPRVLELDTFAKTLVLLKDSSASVKSLDLPLRTVDDSSDEAVLITFHDGRQVRLEPRSPLDRENLLRALRGSLDAESAELELAPRANIVRLAHASHHRLLSPSAPTRLRPPAPLGPLNAHYPLRPPLSPRPSIPPSSSELPPQASPARHRWSNPPHASVAPKVDDEQPRTKSRSNSDAAGEKTPTMLRFRASFSRRKGAGTALLPSPFAEHERGGGGGAMGIAM